MGYPDQLFTADRLARVGELEQWHFWFMGRRLLITRLLNEYLPQKSLSILDLGCGTGLTAAKGLGPSWQTIGVDLRPEGLQATRRKLPEAALVQADALHLPLPKNSYDAVLLLDVLEHLDDQALLAELQRIIRPNGLLFVTVPAIPGLWSYRDEAAGHLRRYSPTLLQNRLNNGGFLIRDMRYFQFLMLPALIITRLLGRRGPRFRDIEESPGSFINELLKRVIALEVTIGKRVRWPSGSSLVAICERKPNE